MTNAISVRIEEEFLHKIDSLGKDTGLDRSTVIRQLISKGYDELVKEKMVQKYVEGKLTFSAAAHRAGMTLWDFEKFLVEKGFKSQYSIEDLQEEIKLLSR
ncbi:MAG: UPF0175 family protein [Candidatus Woesearchaeota archaeon]